MMAITTADDFFNAPIQRIIYRKPNVGTSGSNLNEMSMWTYSGNPVAGTASAGNTTTGVLFDDTYTGAVPINSFGSGATGYLSRARYINSTANSHAVLFDRLWGAGTFSMSSTATTNFSSQPSYAGRLPGGNDYSTAEVLIEITTTVAGTTPAASVVIGYTNENGTTGRLTQSISVGPGLPGFVGRIFRPNLQDGDKGIQKIDSVAVTGSATITAGDFNVIVARRIASFECTYIQGNDTQAWDSLVMPQLFDTSCLMITVTSSSTNIGICSLALDIING